MTPNKTALHCVGWIAQNAILNGAHDGFAGLACYQPILLGTVEIAKAKSERETRHTRDHPIENHKTTLDINAGAHVIRGDPAAQSRALLAEESVDFISRRVVGRDQVKSAHRL